MAEPCTMVPADRNSSLETVFFCSRDVAGIKFTPYHLLYKLHFIFKTRNLVDHLSTLFIYLGSR